MPVESKIYSALSGATVVTAVVSSRIYPMAIPQSLGVAAFPALVYARAGSLRVNSLSGYSNLENAQVEITCWATRYNDAKDLSTRVHSIMNAATAFRATLTDDADGIEPEAGLFSLTMNFSVWNRE